MKILSRPFPITYILGSHQHEISQKEDVSPELKAVEVFIQTFSHNIYPKNNNNKKKKTMSWIRDTEAYEAYLSKAKECEKERRIFTYSLKGPQAWALYQPKLTLSTPMNKHT